MQCLEVSGVVRPIYGSLGFKGLGLISPFQARHLDTDVAPYMSNKIMPENVNLKTAGEYSTTQYIWD
jgi:hypothetical protein